MAKEGVTPGEFRFEPQAVAAQATKIAEKALIYYSDHGIENIQSGQYFEVNDVRRNNSGLVKVFTDWAVNRKKHSSCPLYQQMFFHNGILTEANSANRLYLFKQNEVINEVIFEAKRFDLDGVLINTIQGEFGSGIQWMNESFQFHGINLQAEYGPATKDGFLGFKLQQIKYFFDPLPAEDTAILLPEGRFIALEPVLTAAIHPKLDLINITTGKENCQAITGRNDVRSQTITNTRFNFFGQAYPQPDNPNNWLVFANFQNGKKSNSRLLQFENIDAHTIGQAVNAYLSENYHPIEID